MKYHCFFEQSGTFKNEFKKLGFDLFDYDILNEFGETDFVIDLFRETKKHIHLTNDKTERSMINKDYANRFIRKFILKEE